MPDQVRHDDLGEGSSHGPKSQPSLYSDQPGRFFDVGLPVRIIPSECKIEGVEPSSPLRGGMLRKVPLLRPIEVTAEEPEGEDIHQGGLAALFPGRNRCKVKDERPDPPRLHFDEMILTGSPASKKQPGLSERIEG